MNRVDEYLKVNKDTISSEDVFLLALGLTKFFSQSRDISLNNFTTLEANFDGMFKTFDKLLIKAITNHNDVVENFHIMHVCQKNNMISQDVYN